MEEMALVIMEKDPETGYLSKELGTYSINYNIDMVSSIFVSLQDGKRVVNMSVTIPGEFEDWEYNAIMDNYNHELFENIVISIKEDEESYNPAWVMVFDFMDNDDAMEKKLNDILAVHSAEAERVIAAAKELESEYRD